MTAGCWRTKFYSLYVFIIPADIVEYFERYTALDNIATIVMRSNDFLRKDSLKISRKVLKTRYCLACSFNSLAPELLFFLISAHSVYKM